MCAALIGLLFTQNVWAEAETPAPDTTAEATPTPEPTPTPTPITTNDIVGWPQMEQTNGDSCCLMDADTGTVLVNKGMDEQRYPASITKVMTCLIALENSSPADQVTFTQTGVNEAYSGSSNLYTQVGEVFTMEQCLYGLMLKSANDFASQIAEQVSGSVENFVQMMNDRAAALGCTNTHFNNAHGLPDENHYTTAHDMALILREAVKNPEFVKIAGTTSYTIPATNLTEGARTFDNHNAMLFSTSPYYYENCIAGKTGFTDSALNTFMAAGQKDGRTLVAVSMHYNGAPEVITDCKNLLEYGFNNFQVVQMSEPDITYRNGSVTIPANAAAADVVTARTGTEQTEAGEMVGQTYTFHDYTLCSGAITKEGADALDAAEAGAQQPTPEPTVQVKDEAQTDIATAPEKEETVPFPQRLLTKTYLIIEGLALLVLVGIILIIVSAVKKNKAKKRKRKRR